MYELYAVYKRFTLGQKVKRWKKIFHENSNQKRAGAAILILDKMDCKTKVVITDRKKERKERRKSEVAQSCPTLCDPMDTRLLHPWDFLGKSTGVGCHFLFQGYNRQKRTINYT